MSFTEEDQTKKDKGKKQNVEEEQRIKETEGFVIVGFPKTLEQCKML